MSNRTYQTHDEDLGVSDSFRKLQRLHLPDDLAGKSVLDIGCSEGFFCGEAAKRNAARVVGIDTNVGYLNFARDRYGAESVEFQLRDWYNLPDEKFDLVIWTSAMHYEMDPKKVIDNIRSILRDDGLFILECGVSSSSGYPEFFPVPRYSDTTFYPDISILTNHLLRSFSIREVAPGEVTEGDPIPRRVFHCRPIKTTVIVITGSTHDGKSFLADRYLAPTATKVFHIDNIIWRIASSQYSHSRIEEFIKGSYNPSNLLAAYNAINAVEGREEFAGYLAKLVSPSDECVVIEGNLSEEFCDALSQALSERAVVWTMGRVAPPLSS